MSQKGMTLPEMLLVLVVVATLLAITAVQAVPWIGREAMRGGLYDAHTLMQITRIEAVERNHDCRFVLDVATRTMRIIDTNGTPSTGDDIELMERALPRAVSLARPDAGSAVSLHFVSGSEYEVVFNSDGYVRQGAGEMVLYGGDRFGRLTVFAAGGVRFDRWDGSSWQTGV